MNYHLDAQQLSLAALKKRLETTDLIPSQQPLLHGIKEKMAALERSGIASVADLRTRSKSSKSLASLACATGIDQEYIVLLRRVVEGFLPKPHPLAAFDWMDPAALADLARGGIRDTRALYELGSSKTGASEITSKTGVGAAVLSELLALSGLSRIQWVSPTFARVLVAAGFTTAAQIATAEPDALFAAVLKANEAARFYKGKVGIRDIKRLIAAAAYVP